MLISKLMIKINDQYLHVHVLQVFKVWRTLLEFLRNVTVFKLSFSIVLFLSSCVDPNVEFVFVFVYCLMFSSKIFHLNRDV